MKKTLILLLIICMSVFIGHFFMPSAAAESTLSAPDQPMSSDGSNRYYEVIKVGDYDYRVYLFDSDHRTMRELKYPKRPYIKMATDNIIEIVLSVGSPLNYTEYYDVSLNRLSDPFTNVLQFGNHKVIFAKKGSLVVSDIFDKNIYYKEIVRDFFPTAVPSLAILEVKWEGRDQLMVRYWEGPNKVEKVEVIQLDE
jgi:hypothetical protein